MKEEEQRVAIAEALGRKYHKPTEKEIRSGSYYQYEPDLNDLNLCHDFENLTSSEWLAYEVHLTEVITRNHGECTKRHLINATAAQRCEAFLKTKNLWKD